MTKTHDGQEDQTTSARKYMRGWMSQETANLRLREYRKYEKERRGSRTAGKSHSGTGQKNGIGR